MVDIEQRALGAFEQDAAAVAPAPVEQRPHRIHEGQDLGADLGELIVQLVSLEISGFAQAPPQRVVVGQQPFDLGLAASCRFCRSMTRIARRPTLSS